MKTVIETERLFLREMNMDDFEALREVLSDRENMKYYPYVFDETKVKEWIQRNLNRYEFNGFGLWTVCLKESGEVIGDCGLSLQNIQGEVLPEIGFHIRRDLQKQGYGKEAAAAVLDWAFRNTKYKTIYSCCKYTNEPSIRTAQSIGMHLEKEYPDSVNIFTSVSVIHWNEYLEQLKEKMISWAQDRLGSTKYNDSCLSFIEDALEKSNHIKICGGNSAKDSYNLYKDELHQGKPERGAFVFYDCLSISEEGPIKWGHCGISLRDGQVIHAFDRVRIDDYLEIEKLTAPGGDHPRYLGWVTVERVLRQKPSGRNNE